MMVQGMPAGNVPFSRMVTYSLIEATTMSDPKNLKIQYKLRSVLILSFPIQISLLRRCGFPRIQRSSWPLILPGEAILLYLN